VSDTPATDAIHDAPAQRRSRLSTAPLSMRGFSARAADKSGYKSPAGVLPSVTRVLAATSEGKEALAAWLKRPGSAVTSEAARRRGTWTHSQIEAWIRGEEPQKSFAFGAYWRNVRPWLEQHFTEALCIEKAVWHPRGFAGTLDCLGYCTWGEHPDALAIMDWKTSQRQRSGPLLADYFAQLGAYRLAASYTYGIHATRGVLVIARPHAAGPDVHELTPGALDAAEQAFLRRLDAYYAMPQDAGDTPAP
jgi:hypothetical protein